jgi:hypothetical protein
MTLFEALQEVLDSLGCNIKGYIEDRNMCVYDHAKINEWRQNKMKSSEVRK